MFQESCFPGFQPVGLSGSRTFESCFLFGSFEDQRGNRCGASSLIESDVNKVSGVGMSDLSRYYIFSCDNNTCFHRSSSRPGNLSCNCDKVANVYWRVKGHGIDGNCDAVPSGVFTCRHPPSLIGQLHNIATMNIALRICFTWSH